MFFLNLSLPEFFALLGTLSAGVFALYLLDRQRRRVQVATLRFFRTAEKQPQMQHRRRLQQPWSLFLQLLSLLLLLLAIAQLRLGSPDRSSRDHVVILDASAWMGARTANGRLIDEARASARAYVKALPSADRVMVVRAGELATPATLFEQDRDKIRRAIDETQPGASALSIDQALEFAQQAQKLRARRAGEIVFIGAGRAPGDGTLAAALPSNLRVIPVKSTLENVGLRKVGLRRSMNDADVWDIFVEVKNYGTTARTVPLLVQFGGAPVGTKQFLLKAGEEQSATFQHRTRAAGWLDARLLVHDAFPQDDRAQLELPGHDSLPVTIYSDEPDLLRPVFNVIPGVKPTFLPPSSYKAESGARIVILDRFAPPSPPKTAAIWIEPPPQQSPIPVRTTGTKLKLARWRSDHALGTGLRARDVELESSEVFRTAADDIAIAETDSGPVIVGRSSEPKVVVLGFHPVKSALKYELATPLLFANILHWMAPDILRSTEVMAGTVGTVNADLESEPDPATVRVVSENGQDIPFTVDGRKLRFFTEVPGTVRVLTGGRELVYSLTLPQAGDTVWNPATAKHGIPSSFRSQTSSRDVWQLLALAAAVLLVVDWFLFGRMRRLWRAAQAASPRAAWRKAS
ncbi:MAG TPA: BatA and WFA domain-containing protein [Bryobacteraceae bacterium]|nr:BatA and WFA domain-containing protein [Bryobacteraceae bacterium]